jgi:hypothetical protein
MNVRFEAVLSEPVSSNEEYERFKGNIDDSIPAGKLQSLEQGEKILLKISISRGVMFDSNAFLDSLEDIPRIQSVEDWEEIV